MPTKTVIELPQFGHNIINKILGVIPLNIHKTSNRCFVTNANIKKSTKIIWTGVRLTSFTVTLIEIYKNLYKSNQANLVTLFYHVLLLLSKVVGLISVCVFQTKHKEYSLSVLLQGFCTVPNGLVTASCKSPLKFNKKSFPILLALVPFTSLLFYAAIILAVTVLFPCIYETFIPHLDIDNNCRSTIFRCFALILHGPFLLVISLFSYLQSGIYLVTLHDITNDFCILR